MADVTIVTTIVSNAKTILAAGLSGWSQLLYEYELDQNPANTKTQRYGFIPQGGGDVSRDGASRLGRVTFDQIFQLILMDTYRNQDNDSNQRAKVVALQDKAHDMMKLIKANRIGGRIVTPVNFELPEFFDDEAMNAVAIKLNINVKYDYAVT